MFSYTSTVYSGRQKYVWEVPQTSIFSTAVQICLMNIFLNTPKKPLKKTLTFFNMVLIIWVELTKAPAP